MIWGIVLYYLWVVLGIYLAYVVLYNTYEDEKFSDRIKFPLWLHIVAFVVAFIPGINIFTTIGIIVFMCKLHSEDDAYFKSFLFKKL